MNYELLSDTLISFFDNLEHLSDFDKVLLRQRNT